MASRSVTIKGVEQIGSTLTVSDLDVDNECEFLILDVDNEYQAIYLKRKELELLKEQIDYLLSQFK